MNDENNDKLSSLKVVDTENMLTLDEVQELKRIATASKFVRYMFILLFGVLSVVGFPTAVNWVSKHIQ